MKCQGNTLFTPCRNVTAIRSFQAWADGGCGAVVGQEAAGRAGVNKERLACQIIIQKDQAAAGMEFYRPGGAGPFPCLYLYGLWQLVQTSPYRWWLKKTVVRRGVSCRRPGGWSTARLGERP